MPGKQAVWGIDLGQCAMKALKLRWLEGEQRPEAVSFDFIEYSKILSQPDANAAEEIQKALETFLSRNEVKGDRLGVSVPGQAAFARFVKLPPVETKKIPEIVRYEARQQIPFDLSEVVWDYQTIGEGTVEEGYALETEIGLFAIRREVVQQVLNHFTARGVELDLVQTTPLALYNFLQYDQNVGTGATVLLDIGVENTNLVIVDGARVWQQNVPIGGNTFTKALTRDFKLTYAKAEHLKRNATKSKDARQVFQSMRPVFHDLVGEVQRSLGYYQSLNRDSKIQRVLALGNAFKLPGLQRFLSQNLNIEVIKPTEFSMLTGSTALATPIFQENATAFAVAYGLALQGLELTKIHTNLILPEILQERLIRRKKPWLLTAAATLLVGFASLFLGAQAAEKRVSGAQDENLNRDADEWVKKVTDKKTEQDGLITAFAVGKTSGNLMTSVLDKQQYWPKLLRAIDAGLPMINTQSSLPLNQREEVNLTRVAAEYTKDVAAWWRLMGTLAGRMSRAGGQAGTASGGLPTAGEPGAAAVPDSPELREHVKRAPADAKKAPIREGWLIRLEGSTFFEREAWPTQRLVPSLTSALADVGGVGVTLLISAPHEEEAPKTGATVTHIASATYARNMQPYAQDRLGLWAQEAGVEARVPGGEGPLVPITIRETPAETPAPPVAGSPLATPGKIKKNEFVIEFLWVPENGKP